MTWEYPKLQPVFNVALLARYQTQSQVQGLRVLEGVKDTYYNLGRVVDWSKLHQILDTQPVKVKTQNV
ncbi:hypothetical protein PCANC_06976 [Puccinia coronata f. sp. avenae]|uniref:Uncharacterized protein n=1 Tax=Puccinia coronata f. sp. avenae TaxID=200324 RepID=A0A2N5VKW1_9BASI|nr:hypothetical protein PCANC_06976 [Puccinia coronata f. sp. avenae]